MPANWTEIRNQVSAFRNYLKNLSLPSGSGITKKYSFVISSAEIEKLLSQKNDGSRLDGLRIYLGADMADGQFVPNIHVIACELSGKATNGPDDHYEDYHVPKNEAELDARTADKTLPLLAETKPCPPMCSSSNILNS